MIQAGSAESKTPERDPGEDAAHASLSSSN